MVSSLYQKLHRFPMGFQMQFKILVTTSTAVQARLSVGPPVSNGFCLIQNFQQVGYALGCFCKKKSPRWIQEVDFFCHCSYRIPPKIKVAQKLLAFDKVKKNARFGKILFSPPQHWTRILDKPIVIMAWELECVCFVPWHWLCFIMVHFYLLFCFDIFNSLLATQLLHVNWVGNYINHFNNYI
uniref:Uncharacterized protein n=1 Tax=Micrurus lemniscatus lemniscatus TaxID=129467 RepID=A0A2D4HIY8_MICLE